MRRNRIRESLRRRDAARRWYPPSPCARRSWPTLDAGDKAWSRVGCPGTRRSHPWNGPALRTIAERELRPREREDDADWETSQGLAARFRFRRFQELIRSVPRPVRRAAPTAIRR